MPSLTQSDVRIRGIGVDVASVERFARLLGRYGPRFAERWFREAELRELRDGAPSAYASRFAAKEATWKALALDWTAGFVPWRHISVLTSQLPVEVLLHEQVAVAAHDAGIGSIVISMTWHRDYAVASAIALTVGPGDYRQSSSVNGDPSSSQTLPVQTR